jgi:glucose/arabinose dehydrogenase
MTFHSTFFRRAAGTALAALCVSPLLTGAAEPINDPIPARIAPSDVRIELQRIADGLGSPLLLFPAPDKSNRLFVVDQQGHLRIVHDNKLLPEPLLDVTGRLVKLLKDFDERGLLGAACDPGFADAQSPGKGRIFTYTSEPATRAADFPIVHGKIPADHQSVIASWRVSASDPNRIDLASRKEVLRIDEPQFNHNGGMIAFGPDGFLYIGTGDGGAGNDLGPGHNPEIGNGQDKNVLLGKMLRIDVNGTDSRNGAYGIPKDNPFAAGGGAREIFAIGLRNPFRFSFDGPALLAGDVGQNKLEMLYRVERGGNYGWRNKEGTFKFNKNGTIEAPEGLLPGFTDPVLQYDHDEGISIIGGYVYHGNAIPALKGKYVFGDYRSGTKTNTGRIFVGDLNTREIKELRVGSQGRDPGFLVKGFGQDTAGELYVMGSAEPGPTGVGGVVYKILGLAVP